MIFSGCEVSKILIWSVEANQSGSIMYNFQSFIKCSYNILFYQNVVCGLTRRSETCSIGAGFGHWKWNIVWKIFVNLRWLSCDEDNAENIYIYNCIDHSEEREARYKTRYVNIDICKKKYTFKNVLCLLEICFKWLNKLILLLSIKLMMHVSLEQINYKQNLEYAYIGYPKIILPNCLWNWS